MTLYLCQQKIDLTKLYHWAGHRKLMTRQFDDGYALHAFFGENLGNFAPKPFRLMQSTGSKYATLYGYSPHSAEQINQAAKETAEPEYQSIASDIIDKPMPDHWKEDRRLGFDIKIRPTTRSRNEDNRMVERDAFLSTVVNVVDNKDSNRQQVYIDWLDTRLNNNGATIADKESVRMKHMQLTRVVRKRNDRAKSMGPECVLQGELKITSSEAFKALLANGLGRHKSYGFGMLLLKPAR